MNNAEYAAMCQYNKTWLLRDDLIRAMAEIVSQVCVNHKSKSDGNLIIKYPCRYILAPGQAHDADNHSAGSLIH